MKNPTIRSTVYMVTREQIERLLELNTSEPDLLTSELLKDILFDYTTDNFLEEAEEFENSLDPH